MSDDEQIEEIRNQTLGRGRSSRFYCWHCGHCDRLGVDLYADPIQPHSDRIGVCLECCRQRSAEQIEEIRNKSNFELDRPHLSCDAEIARLSSEVEQFGRFVFDTCPTGEHADYAFDSENGAKCPGCTFDALSSEVGRLNRTVTAQASTLRMGRVKELEAKVEELKRKLSEK